MIRWVFFDVAGTLLHVKGGVVSVYANIARGFGIQVDADVLGRRFQAAWKQWMGPDQDGPTDASDQLVRWQGIVGDCFPGIVGEQSDRLFASLWDTFRRSETWGVDPQAHTVIDALLRQGYRVGLASNFDDRLVDVIAGFPELKRLERVFYSSSVGWSKPSKHFFRHVEKEIEARPDQILIVGDTIENDFLGPIRCGWQAILFDPHQRSPNRQPRVEELSQLIDVLASSVRSAHDESMIGETLRQKG